VAVAFAAALLPAFFPSPAEAQLKKGKVLRPDQKTCVDCHAKEVKDYAARSSKHAPVAAGTCEACHKRHGVVGVLRLVAEDPDLCLSCHTKEGQKGGGPHPPAMTFPHPPADKQKCGACHDPHGASVKSLLKQTGSSACLTCHDPKGFQGTSVHAVALDCLRCHLPHGGPEPAGLREKPDTLCVSCHEGKSESELKAHGGIRPGGASCLSCHAPHASPSPGLMRRIVHPPLADGCGSCHGDEAGAGGKFPTVAAVPELCLACHEDPRATPAGAKGAGEWRPHHPVGEGNCLTCHAPHASDQKGLLARPQAKLCGTCHAEAEAAARAKAPHRPALDACTACHAPHGGPAGLLRARAPDLCTECHATVKTDLARKVAHPPAAAGDCLTCHAPHGSDHAGILLDGPVKLCGACHDSVAKATASSRPHPPVNEGRCVACHVPHGGDGDHLLVADVAAACLKCHAGTGKEFPEGQRHAPFAGGDCLVCHQPHGGSRDGILVSEPLALCRSCHDALPGEEHATVRHAPLARGQCLACHGPHGGHLPGLLRLADSRTLCVSCHAEEGRAAVSREGVVHPPFRKEPCITCHEPHVSSETTLLRKAPGALCTGCHDAAAPAMRTSHRGLVRATTDCTGCHAGHTSEAKKLILPVLHAPFGEGECGACHTGAQP